MLRRNFDFNPSQLKDRSKIFYYDGHLLEFHLQSDFRIWGVKVIKH